MTLLAPVCVVTAVRDHPEDVKSSLVSFRDMPKSGYPEISAAKLEGGSPRYRVGDWLVFLPEGAVLPDWLRRRVDIRGDDKARVEAPGALYGGVVMVDHWEQDCHVVVDGVEKYAQLGEDVGGLLGITAPPPGQD